MEQQNNALVPVKTVTVPFRGGEIEAVEYNGKIYVNVRKTCEELGIESAAQTVKINNDRLLSSTTSMIESVASDGRNREQMFISLNGYTLWLASIQESRVREEVREMLFQYKLEAAQVLGDYFSGKPVLSNEEYKIMQIEDEVLRGLLMNVYDAEKRLKNNPSDVYLSIAYSHAKTSVSEYYNNMHNAQLNDVNSRVMQIESDKAKEQQIKSITFANDYLKWSSQVTSIINAVNHTGIVNELTGMGSNHSRIINYTYKLLEDASYYGSKIGWTKRISSAKKSMLLAGITQSEANATVNKRFVIFKDKKLYNAYNRVLKDICLAWKPDYDFSVLDEIVNNNEVLDSELFDLQ